VGFDFRAARVLVLPGLGNSGPLHWQTLWEKEHGFSRVEQRDWERPRYDDWAANLERAVAAAGPDTVLVAHSLACLLVARWARATQLPIKGALLVAPPDPDAITFPEDAIGFAPIEDAPLPFPAILVASSDDPYADIGFARACARIWGARFVDAGASGHINADSGFGAWEAGLELLRSLTCA
jgi:predicted alpha/beta hydrolase family esterase